jgi:hypothetical protein
LAQHRSLIAALGRSAAGDAELQLEFELERPPQALTVAERAVIRDRIREVLTIGTPNTRKAMCEALIREIQIIADDTVRPVFKLPIDPDDEGPAPTGPNPSSSIAVRALPTTVGRTWQNRNRVVPVQGPDVTVMAVRRRAAP